MNEIYCPYCKEEYPNPEYLPEEDGEKEKYQCECCGKYFEVELYIEIIKEFTSFEMEQPEPEEKKPVDVPNQTYFSFFEPIGV